MNNALVIEYKYVASKNPGLRGMLLASQRAP